MNLDHICVLSVERVIYLAETFDTNFWGGGWVGWLGVLISCGNMTCVTRQRTMYSNTISGQQMQWNPILASASLTSVSASPNGSVRHTPPTVKPFGVRNGPICPASMSTNGHRIRHSSLLHPPAAPIDAPRSVTRRLC